MTNEPIYEKLAPARIVAGADKILALKKQNKLWESIEMIVKLWASENPKQWRSHLVEIQDVKDTRKRTRVGSKEFVGLSKDKKTGGYLNYMIDVPEKIIYMIRAVYKPDELPMNKKFYREFGRRFPAFVVSETKK